MKKIYISGPMKGIENSNKEAFKKAKIKLLKEGYLVTNPFDVVISIIDPSYEDYMRFDIRALTFCDCIYMLKGHEKSKGANIEKIVAENIGLEVLYEA